MSTTTTGHTANHPVDFHGDEPLLGSEMSFHDITELVSSHTEKRTPIGWLAAFAVANIGLLILVASIAYLFWNGPGVWGLNNPVGWGFAIVNFVFWVGIGHAGTLISGYPLPVQAAVENCHLTGPQRR